MLSVVEGTDRVLVFDLGSVAPERHTKGQDTANGPALRPLAILQHKQQRQVLPLPLSSPI